MAKKRFTFADAKLKIKELEDKIESFNVDLSDNIVTQDELKVLKLYKKAFFIAAGVIGVLLLVGIVAIF